MANLKRRSIGNGATSGFTPSAPAQPTFLSGGWQAYPGPGEIVAAVFDYTSSSSGCVLTFYDGTRNSDPQIYTRSSDTDAGTTVPITMYTDGDLPAGTSTANVKAGIPFCKGLYVEKSGDVTHDVQVTLFIRPLIAKSVDVKTTGSAGSAVGSRQLFSGPGRLAALRIAVDPATPSTMDFLIKDGLADEIAGTGAGNTLLTKTNYGLAVEAVRPVVTLTGSDEAGSAVSTAATGAYASPGIFFNTGLNISVQQSNAFNNAVSVIALVEA